MILKKTYIIVTFILLAVGLLIFSSLKYNSHILFKEYEQSFNHLLLLQQEVKDLSLFAINEVQSGGRKKLAQSLSYVQKMRNQIMNKTSKEYQEIKKFKGTGQEKLLHEVQNIEKAISYIDIGIHSITNSDEFDPIHSFFDLLNKSDKVLSQKPDKTVIPLKSSNGKNIFAN